MNKESHLQEIIKVYEYANYLVNNDETERALTVLDCLPGYYRDNPPDFIKDMKKLIKAKMYTAQDYALNDGDAIKDIEYSKQSIYAIDRFKIFKEKLDEANKKDIKPHVIDMGPGDYCLPIGLSAFGADFSYSPIGLQASAMHDARVILEKHWATYPVSSRPNWFVAFEIIEHLTNVDEIRQQFDRIPDMPTKVFLSTPTYTFGNGTPEWKKVGIHHLRTYTPQEFFNVAQRLFPEYNLTYLPSQVQTIIGDLKG